MTAAEAKNKRGKGTYDLIVVDGAVEDMPKALASQLADNGRIITGLLENGVTRLAKGRKVAGEIAFLPIAEIGIPVIAEFRAAKAWSF